MKIFFFIDSLHQGGAARMITLIANKLAERNYEVCIGTNTYNEIVYFVDKSVKIFNIYPQNAYGISRIRRFFLQQRLIRKSVKEAQPDIIVTTIPTISFLVKIATLFLKIPTIFCDVTSYARKDSRWYHFLRYHFYKLADAVTIETENDRRILGKRLRKKVVINDPLAFEIYRGEEQRENCVLAIGPTEEWEIKGFDMLFEAWGRIANQHPGWTLKLAGSIDPPSVVFLKEILKKYHAENSVEFLGFQKDIISFMRSASVFALASRIEGFSLSIIEAISQGCPCVCFRTVGVMTEVTEDGTGAIIVEDGDVDTYSITLNTLINDKGLRDKLSTDGRGFVSKYELGGIVSQWETLFEALLSK